MIREISPIISQPPHPFILFFVTEPYTAATPNTADAVIKERARTLVPAYTRRREENVTPVIKL